MIRQRIIIIGTLMFWLVVGGLVFRTNRLWPSGVTFRWHNLSSSNAMFRWSTAPVGKNVIIPANATKSFKVVVPRKFSTGELIIATVPGQGRLTVNVNGSAGNTNSTASTPAGGIATVTLDWDNIALQTRTFNVEVMTDTSSVEIQSISLRLQP